MDKAVQPAPGGARTLRARRPEETPLYQLVQKHLETFLAQVELESGAGLPDFVKEEFDAFLECGILAHGFLRLRCADCAHEKLIAFSCKRRGFCPACGARRMAETAAAPTCVVTLRKPSGGTLKIIAAIEDPPLIAKILAHLGFPTRAPPRSPAQVFDPFPMA
jgi:Ribosomal protein S27E